MERPPDTSDHMLLHCKHDAIRELRDKYVPKLRHAIARVQAAKHDDPILQRACTSDDKIIWFIVHATRMFNRIQSPGTQRVLHSAYRTAARWTAELAAIKDL